MDVLHFAGMKDVEAFIHCITALKIISIGTMCRFIIERHVWFTRMKLQGQTLRALGEIRIISTTYHYMVQDQRQDTSICWYKLLWRPLTARAFGFTGYYQYSLEDYGDIISEHLITLKHGNLMGTKKVLHWKFDVERIGDHWMLCGYKPGLKIDIWWRWPHTGK